MVDIFDEVEEDLRAERTQRLLKKYGWLLAAAALAVIGATIGWQAWTARQASQDMEAARRYVAAQALADKTLAGAPVASDRAEALTAFEQQAATAPEGYRTLARLRAAGLKADAGDLAGASALWDQIAADSDADRLLRDLATLIAAQHQLDYGDPTAIEARLKPLTDPANPWSALAREQLALLDLRQGKTEDARAALRRLSFDILAPAGLRQRAAAILAGSGGGTGE